MRYYNLARYLRNRHGRRAAKISLDAGLSCPNRDGAISRGGCLFCDRLGSGTGRGKDGRTIDEQMARGLAQGRADCFIAYFQAYTNTYAPAVVLRDLWDRAVSYDGVVGLSVGTRPDCLPDEIMDLLAGYNRLVEVWLEIGLQSAHDPTLESINRGHDAAAFIDAVGRAHERGLKVVGHVIIGLPGEGEAEVIKTANLVADLGLFGVKIHSLYVPRDSGLAGMVESGEFTPPGLAEFARLAALFLERLPPGAVVHRLTGDPDPATLLAPDWTLDKQAALAAVRSELEARDTWQGRLCGAPRPDIS